MQLSINDFGVSELAFDELSMVDGGFFSELGECVGAVCGYAYGMVSNIIAGGSAAAHDKN